MTEPNADNVLEVSDLQVNYGAITALKGISFNVKRGQIMALIGANGAGKSTTLRAISGILKPTSGQVRFEGESITGLKANEIVAKGLLQAPEGRGIFTNMTVLENLYLGAYLRKDHHEISSDLQRIFDLFPRLKERKSQNAGTLSGGEQQMLAIGRSLMGRPKILLLDEPSLGLAPQIIDKIFDTIVAINKQGTSILLVEQNALLALEVAHEALALETGKVKVHGRARDLLESEEIKKAYLGE